MEDNQSGLEKFANTLKKGCSKLLRNKFFIILLIIVVTIILLVACLLEVLDYDTTDKSSKTNEQQYNKDINIEYKIC